MNDNNEEKVLFKVSFESIEDEESRVTKVETHISSYEDIFEVCFAIHKLFKSVPGARGLVEAFGIRQIDEFLEQNSLHVPDFNELLKNNNK